MLKELLTIVVAVAVIIFVPFLTVWALNVLFPVLAIPYTLETWAAIIILAGTMTHTRYINRK